MKFNINKYNLNTNKNISDIKICLISDIHYCDNFNNNILDEILSKLKDINPDYICIAGDIIDSYPVIESPNIGNLTNFFITLGKICKVFICLGNHDVFNYYNKKEYYKNSKWFDKLRQIDNIYLLDNNIYSCIDNISFIGYTPLKEHYKLGEKNSSIIKKTLFKLSKNVNMDSYNILLCHTPIGFVKKDILTKLKRVDLIVCGHTHGGLMPNFIKGNMGLVSPAKRIFPKNVRGHINKYDVDIIISSGITKLSKTTKVFANFNFLYKPEITVIDVKGVKNK